MKLRDRLWLWRNKKPQRPLQSYLHVVFLWALYGMLLGWGTVMAVAILDRWYIGSGVIFFCLVMLTWFYCSDRRSGYVNVIHQHWLVKWLARKERIKGEK